MGQIFSVPKDNANIIICVGLPGSGKSSVINTIFHNPCKKVFVESNLGSTALEDGEPRMILASFIAKIDRRTGKEFSIYEFPGFEINDQLSNLDNRIIATISNIITYASTSSRIFLLVTARHDDNRVDGENSSFVQMIKRLRRLRYELLERLEIMLVLTHVPYPVETEATEKQQLFEKLFLKHMRMDKSRLETITFFKRTLQQPRDDIDDNMTQLYSRMVSNTAPPNLECVIKSTKTAGKFPLIDGKHSLVADTLKLGILQNTFNPPNSTSPLIMKVSELYQTEEQSEHVQRCIEYLDQNSYYTEDSLPKGEQEIAKFLQMMTAPLKVVSLLRNHFSLPIPTISPLSIHTGLGFNFIQNKTTSCIYKNEEQMGSLTPCGYQLPSYLKCEATGDSEKFKIIYKRKKSWSELRALYIRDISSLNDVVPQGVDWMEKPFFAAGYNYSQDVSTSVVRFYRKYWIRLEKEAEFSSDFAADVELLNEESNFVSFFERYGTHIVIGNYTGGYEVVSVTPVPGCGQILGNEPLGERQMKKLLQNSSYGQQNFSLSGILSKYSVHIREYGLKLQSLERRGDAGKIAMILDEAKMLPIYDIIAEIFPEKIEVIRRKFKSYVGN